MRTTVAGTCVVSGIGLHSGEKASVSISPAGSWQGIRIGRKGGSQVRLSPWSIERTPLCTRVTTPSDSIDTVEHMLAALAILGIDDADIRIDGGEVPILDGSAEPWARALMGIGIRNLTAPRVAPIVTSEFSYVIGESSYRATPGEPLIEVGIEFDNPVIGCQDIRVVATEARSLLDSRTFTLESEISRLRSLGLAKGGSLDNAIVVGSDSVLNPDGLRHADEFVRHKALDLLGDLSVAGGIIQGRIEARRPGHASNNAFLTAMIDAGALWLPAADPIGMAA